MMSDLGQKRTFAAHTQMSAKETVTSL